MSLKVVVPTVAALGAGAAIAVAQIGGGNAPITGCVLTSQDDSTQPIGSLRVIDPTSGSTVPGATSCFTDEETQITWNQQVPAVTTVETGPAGPQGPTGPQGAPGQVITSSGSSADITMLLAPTNSLGNLNPTPAGETTDSNSNPTKAFDLSSFTLDAQNALSVGSASAGAGAGKVSFQGFTFTKPLDKYSAELFQDLASGTRLASVEIIVRKPGNNGMEDPIVQYMLKNVGLTNIHIAGASRDATETIQGSFASIQFVLYGQNSNGTTGVLSNGGWSQVTNRPVTIPGLGTIRDTRRHKK